MSKFFSNHRVALIWAGIIAAFAVFAFWAWHGSITAIARTVVASASLKLLLASAIVFAVALFVASIFNDRRDVYLGPDASAKERAHKAHANWGYRVFTGLWVGAVVAAILAVTIFPLIGGYHRATVVAQSAEYSNEGQPEYAWRTPWTVAAQSASSRAGNVVGDFINEDTTYLPALDQFVTPVKARGFSSGLSTVVVQDASKRTAEICTFASEAPVSGGFLGANLSRAISFVDAGLEFNAADAWVYCDGRLAKLVVPVMRMAGQPEATPVPAGVVIYDGANATVVDEVAPGTLPGPVYPSSLAAAQRDSLNASTGLLDAVFGRSGFETSEDTDGDPNSGNVSEILLARADGGYDYVTPLTPRGKSFTVTAVSVVPADSVKAGQLNELTVFKLPTAREGNQAVADRIRGAFPQLNWASGLTIAEVVPTSATEWVATLTNGRVVSNRVIIAEDGSLCLTDPSGKQLSCVDASGSAQPSTTGTTQPGSVPSGDLAALSDADLARLAVEVANEQLRRADTASSPTE